MAKLQGGYGVGITWCRPEVTPSTPRFLGVTKLRKQGAEPPTVVTPKVSRRLVEQTLAEFLGRRRLII